MGRGDDGKAFPSTPLQLVLISAFVLLFQRFSDQVLIRMCLPDPEPTLSMRLTRNSINSTNEKLDTDNFIRVRRTRPADSQLGTDPDCHTGLQVAGLVLVRIGRRRVDGYYVAIR
jgi:hypothetical protein